MGKKKGRGKGVRLWSVGPERSTRIAVPPDLALPPDDLDADDLGAGDLDVRADAEAPREMAPALRSRRLAQIAGWADAVTRPIGWLAVAAALAAVVLWAAWLGPYLLPLSGVPLVAWAALLLLLIPAAATWLLYSLLRDLVVLPQRLAGAARTVVADAKGIAQQTDGGRLRGIVGVLWAARALAFEIKGAPLRYAALLRLARLPVMIPLLFALAADAALVAGAVAAVVIRLVV